MCWVTTMLLVGGWCFEVFSGSVVILLKAVPNAITPRAAMLAASGPGGFQIPFDWITISHAWQNRANSLVHVSSLSFVWRSAVYVSSTGCFYSVGRRCIHSNEPTVTVGRVSGGWEVSWWRCGWDLRTFARWRFYLKGAFLFERNPDMQHFQMRRLFGLYQRLRRA